MRSLLLINFEYPPLGGGAGNATRYLGRAFARLGCSTSVLTARFRGQPAFEECEGVRLYRVPTLRRHEDRCSPLELLAFVASGMARVVAIARECRPDATLAFMGTHCGPVAWWLRRKKGVPYLVLLRGADVPGFLPEQLGAYHRLALPVTRRIWRDAAAIVANSQGLKELADAHLPGFDIRVIPNGVDCDEFHPGGGKDGRVEGWRDGRPLPLHPSILPPLHPSTLPRLLFVGRLSVQKDVPTLLRALARVPSPSAELLLAGDGPERGALGRLAEELGIEGRVRFLGWTRRADLPEVYRSADLFVFPSRVEGMPNAVLEALASGLPVVATRIPGSEELVTPGVNGSLVAVGDEEGLAREVERLLQDPDLRRRYGVASRQIACGLDWEAIVRRYLDLVEAVAPAAGA